MNRAEASSSATHSHNGRGSDSGTDTDSSDTDPYLVENPRTSSNSSEEEDSSDESRADNTTDGEEHSDAEATGASVNAADEANEATRSPSGSPDSLSRHSSDYEGLPPGLELAAEQRAEAEASTRNRPPRCESAGHAVAATSAATAYPNADLAIAPAQLPTRMTYRKSQGRWYQRQQQERAAREQEDEGAGGAAAAVATTYVPDTTNDEVEQRQRATNGVDERSSDAGSGEDHDASESGSEADGEESEAEETEDNESQVRAAGRVRRRPDAG